VVETLSRGVNYIEIEKKIKECVKQSNTYYEEIYITPISSGFKVEISPIPSSGVLEEISKCISTTMNAITSIREYPYGRIIVIKLEKST